MRVAMLGKYVNTPFDGKLLCGTPEGKTGFERMTAFDLWTLDPIGWKYLGKRTSGI